MKKAVALFTAVLLLMAALAGCSSNPADGGDTIPANTVFSKDDLPGKVIGVQESTTGDLYASEYEDEGARVERFNKGNDAVLALKQGKVDCVIIDQEPAKSFVANNDDLMILSDQFEQEEYAICFAKDNNELKDAVNAALQELKADGTIQKIVDNYIGANPGTYTYTSPEGVDRSKGELIMATNAYFPPYEYYEGEKVVGIDADIAQAICDKLGYSLKIEDMEFGSIITAVQTGKAHMGLAGLTITEDRLVNVQFSEPYATATQVIIVRAK